MKTYNEDEVKSLKRLIDIARFYLVKERLSHYKSIMHELIFVHNLPESMCYCDALRYLDYLYHEQRYLNANMPDMAEKYSWGKNFIIKPYVQKSFKNYTV